MNKKRGRKRGFPEHILRVVVPMAGGLPELGVVDVGRNHLLYSGPRSTLFYEKGESFRWIRNKLVLKL
jgi:hypothetical protein